MSLAVKDLSVSRAFYEKLGFSVTGGAENYLIMRQGTTVIGLFQGLFEGNILTFNPGLQANRTASDNPLEDWRVHDFVDVRTIQTQLTAGGVTLDAGVDEAENPDGPACLMLADPDGNAILIDQFFSTSGHRAAYRQQLRRFTLLRRQHGYKSCH